MRISVNGETKDTQGARTIAELVDRFGWPAQTVLIEHNGVALHKREWPARRIEQGDRIEVLKVVAGG